MIRIWIGETIVECWLALEEILLVVFSTRRIGLYVASTGAGGRVRFLLTGSNLLFLCIRDVIKPNEIVAITPIGIFLS